MELEKRNVLVGVRFDGRIRELLNWAIVKVAEPGDRIIALHVCRNADSIAEDKSLLDTYLDDYDGLCNKKQVDIISQASKGSSIRRVLVREAKKHAALAVVLGTSKHSTLGNWTSIAKYCAKRLPNTTEVMAIDNGKVFFRRSSSSKLKGSFGDPKPSLYLERDSTLRGCQSEFGESELSEMGRFSCEVTSTLERWTNGTENKKEESTIRPSGKHKKGSLSLGSISLPTEDIATDPTPGWPLLQTASSVNQPAKAVRKVSVVQWVMSLPNRSMLDSPKSDSSPKETRNAFGMENSYSIMDCNEKESASVCKQLIKDLQLILEANSSGCKWFTYDVLKSSASNFSSENLIGKGGGNTVYKALLSDGKSVAVKVSNSSEEAKKDFRQEMEIMTRVKHRNITHLLGICIEDSDLISVYDFLSKGNLEENIHGRTKSVLRWERRFRIAVGIAEALNYLHNECPRPVIHRDVKSSNILLSDDFEPQLSDFGLAIWGPTKTSYLTHGDVVGTFGYLAPEYFMYGKVSDKVDVYSFGVVLLELLSGRKAIGFETPSGQESLVMWAKPKLESGDLKSILDENLNVNIEDDQVQRMILAARLCLTQAARLRPNISQVLTWLPGKSLLRFKCISKAWNTLIQQPNFMKLHNARSQARSTSLLFQLEVLPDSKEDFATKEKKRRIQEFPLELLAPRHYFYDKEMRICSNHCNGLICLYSFKDARVYLYNVTTGEMKSLAFFVNPVKCPLDPLLVLGLDPATEKYKLIHMFSNKNTRVRTKILTLGIDSSWRKIDGPNFFLTPRGCIFLNGVLYSTKDRYSCIYCFNFREEKFGTISRPLNRGFYRLNQMHSALWGKLVMQCCKYHRCEDRDWIYDELNKVFTKLNYPTCLEEENVLLLEAEKIDESKQANVLATASIIKTPASLTFPDHFQLKYISIFVENIIPLSSLV